jgi:hypothetical protein
MARPPESDDLDHLLPGDLVQHRGQGPRLRIVRIDGDEARCRQYQDDGAITKIRLDELVLVERPDDEDAPDD